MDATLAERALHALAGHAPSSEASCCPGWHYCRGYVLAGVSRWQTRALAVCALIWSLGAQAVRSVTRVACVPDTTRSALPARPPACTFAHLGTSKADCDCATSLSSSLARVTHTAYAR